MKNHSMNLYGKIDLSLGRTPEFLNMRGSHHMNEWCLAIILSGTFEILNRLTSLVLMAWSLQSSMLKQLKSQDNHAIELGRFWTALGGSEKRKERKSESGNQGRHSKWKERGYKPQTQRDNGHDSDKYPLISNLSGHFSDHKCISVGRSWSGERFES